MMWNKWQVSYGPSGQACCAVVTSFSAILGDLAFRSPWDNRVEKSVGMRLYHIQVVAFWKDASVGRALIELLARFWLVGPPLEIPWVVQEVVPDKVLP